jgi:hypothetical protein
MIETHNGQIRYRLSWLEKLASLGSDPIAKTSNVRRVSLRSNPWTADGVRGIRAPGFGFPFLVALGTMRHRGSRDFCVVYRRRPTLILEFQNERFSRWIIPANDQNQEVIKSLGLTITYL